jgi:hypothetical protein
VGLTLLAVINVFTGFWASVDPDGWWSSFPGFGHAWVIGFGSYNEHLVRDVGGFFLAFGVLFAIAAIYLSKRLAGAALGAWLFFAAPHLAFHLRNRGELSSTDNLLSLEGLAVEVIIPVVLLILLPRIRLDSEPPPPVERTPTTTEQDAT